MRENRPTQALPRTARIAFACGLLLGGAASPTLAQDCTHPSNYYFGGGSERFDRPVNCTGWRCYQAEIGSHYFAVQGTCNPASSSCIIELRLPVDFPGVEDMIENPPSPDHPPTPRIYWDLCSPTCATQAVCGLGPAVGRPYIEQDDLTTWVERTNVTCANAGSQAGDFRVTTEVCPSALCPRPPNLAVEISFADDGLPAWIGCGPLNDPPFDGVGPGEKPSGSCGSGLGTKASASGGSSLGRISLLGGSGNPAPPGAGITPPAGSPADMGLHYQAGGPGEPGFPGDVDWRAELGRGWSHRFAERFVEGSTAFHAWFITRAGTFRELLDDDEDGTYELVHPSDDRRTFRKITGGYELLELDGTLHEFDAAGRWVATTDRVGRETLGSYSSGLLTDVALADGRSLELEYDPGGRLTVAREVGIGAAASREWHYDWAGFDLIEIQRPDDPDGAGALRGSRIQLLYAGGSLSRLVRMTLVASGSSPGSRIIGAWEYDADRRVVKAWRGATTFAAANAVDQVEYHYDAPDQTRVIDSYGGESIYTFELENSGKARVVSVSGPCPLCGSAPETTREYEDPDHPLLPTAIIDGEENRTEIEYDDFGMRTLRRDAVGTALERTVEWSWNVTYPALLASETRASTDSTCATSRIRTITYDGSGRADEQTLFGCEAGASFAPLVTSFDYDHALQLEPSVTNPPGFGSADAVEVDLDASRGRYFPTARHTPDPALVSGFATTTFHYDAFNRRIGITDPNGLTTETQYDALNRIVRTIVREGLLGDDFELGDLAAGGDLLTEHTLDGFGDLTRTVLPRQNAIDYGRDHVGRVMSVARKPSAGGQALDRALFTLDDFGHRTAERLERWTGSAWSEQSATDYEYSSQCHLDAIIHDPLTAAQVTEYAYDCNGNLERFWDENHPRDSEPLEFTEYAYDALDRLASVTQPWGGSGATEVETAYDYDVQDNLTSVTDGEGNQTSYVYSDRGLLTAEASPVSGTTTHEYNEHGELVSTTDARSVTTTRTVDAADRVTLVEYSGAPGLDVSFTYGDDDTANEIGRLIGITRHGATIAYEYDRFGRATRDGALLFEYDDNGNRTSISYPDGLEVDYTFDYADREQSLTADPSGENLSVVSAASYLPAGPLSGLTFGNGRSEERAFTNRYFPERITLEPTGGGSALLDWEYATDAVGNPTAINDLVSSPDRSYTYQDHQYFLTGASGPWPGPLGWTYDRIGNRLSEERSSVTDTYAYTAGTSGNTALLATVNLAGGASGTRAYQYTDAGHVIEVDAGANVVDFLVDEDGRLGGLERVAGDAGSSMLYDGRGFLSRVEGFELSSIFRDGFERETTECWSDGVPTPPSPGSPCSSAFRIVEPVYDSAGLLHALGITETLLGSSAAERVLYLAGRPVAIARGDVGALDLLYLTTDHLGTPIAVCDDTGALLWSGGFEPFGADWLDMSPTGADAAGLFLRHAGQWKDAVWRDSSLGSSALVQNAHRWLTPAIGRYNSPDPLGLPDGLDADENPSSLYATLSNNPNVWTDPLGLVTLPPDAPNRCRKRWIKKVLPRLMAPSQACREFFCETLGTDLDALLHDPFPLIQFREGRGGSFGCATNDTGADQSVVKVGKDSCGSTRELLHTVLHELGHYADCWFNNDRFPYGDEGDGCGAEKACLGFSIGSNCR
jgi:RHS repeat-associated protein